MFLNQFFIFTLSIQLLCILRTHNLFSRFSLNFSPCVSGNCSSLSCDYFIFFNRFVANRWLDKKEGDGKIEIELRPSDVIKKDGGKYFNFTFYELNNHKLFFLSYYIWNNSFYWWQIRSRYRCECIYSNVRFKWENRWNCF